MSTDDLEYETMGDRIRQLRQAKNLSQRDLADRITAMGEPITKASIRHWEKGRTKNIRNAYMIALCKILDTDEPYLVYGHQRRPKGRRRRP